MKNNTAFFLTVLFLSIFFSVFSFSANISVNTGIKEADGRFFLHVENIGDTAFTPASITYYFNENSITVPFNNLFNPSDTQDIEIPLTQPEIPGSYNLFVSFNYLNDNAECSSLTGKTIHFGKESLLKPDASSVGSSLYSISVEQIPFSLFQYKFGFPVLRLNFCIFKDGTMSIRTKDLALDTQIVPFLPSQLQITNRTIDSRQIRYAVINKLPEMNNRSKAFFGFEKKSIEGNTLVHSAGFISKDMQMGVFYYILSQSTMFWLAVTPIFLFFFIALGIWSSLASKKDPEKGNFIFYILVILIVSFLTRFFIYNYPFNTFWDENYHVASSQKYIDHVMFMEPHPPLGKLLIALGEVILQPNKGIDTSSFLSTDYISNFPTGYSFLGVRFIPTLLSFLSVLVFFFILYQISKNSVYSFLFTSFYALDNSIILHTRAAMLEGSQLFFILCAILYFLMVYLKKDKIKLTEYLILGLFCGLAISVKLNSMIILLLFVFLALKDHWEELKQINIKEYQKSMEHLLMIIRNIAIKALVSAGSILAVFCLVIYIHGALGGNVNSGRFYQASEAYKDILNRKQNANPLSFPVILRDNIAYVDHYEKGVPKWDPSKKDENGSPAFTWPFGYKSINYRWEKYFGKVGYYYFQGNPVIWWFSLFSVLLSISLIFSKIFFGTEVKDKTKFNLIIIFTVLYAAYMGFMLQLTRVMYLYHYLIPLLFTMILIYLLFEYLFKELIEKNDKIILYAAILLSIEVLAAYLFFSPLTYGLPLSASDFMKRIWMKMWDLRYIYY